MKKPKHARNVDERSKKKVKERTTGKHAPECPPCVPILQTEIRSQRPDLAYGSMQRQRRRGGTGQ